MRLTYEQARKADPLLHDALRHCPRQQVLRTIMILAGPDRRSLEEPELLPSQYSSREEWREALIERQKQATAKDITGALQELRRLSLSTSGGTISPVVVVEGAVEQIVRALNLPGVQRASLDRTVDLRRTRQAQREVS